LGPGGCIII